MSSAGSVMAMIQRLKENSRMREFARERRQRMRDNSRSVKYRGRRRKEKKLSEEELQAFRAELKLDRRKENLKRILVLVISLALTAGILYLMAWYVKAKLQAF